MSEAGFGYPIELPDLPDDNEAVVEPEAFDDKTIRKMGLRAIDGIQEASETKKWKPRPDKESPNILPESLTRLSLGTGRPLHTGGNEPSVSGMRVVSSERPDEGRIRAGRAIERYLTMHSGKATEAALVNCLDGAGFGESKARQFLDEACDEGRLVKVGRFYKLAT